MNKFSLREVEYGINGLRSCLLRGITTPPPGMGDLDILQMLVEHVRLGKVLNGDNLMHTCNDTPSPDCCRCRIVGRMGVIEMLAEE
jgi:hypothetical protein